MAQPDKRTPGAIVHQSSGVQERRQPTPSCAIPLSAVYVCPMIIDHAESNGCVSVHYVRIKLATGMVNHPLKIEAVPQEMAGKDDCQGYLVDIHGASVSISRIALFFFRFLNNCFRLSIEGGDFMDNILKDRINIFLTTLVVQTTKFADNVGIGRSTLYMWRKGEIKYQNV